MKLFELTIRGWNTLLKCRVIRKEFVVAKSEDDLKPYIDSSEFETVKNVEIRCLGPVAFVAGMEKGW